MTAMLLGLAVLCLIAPPSFAQFISSASQPLCGSTYRIDCSTYAPANGVIMGWNVDLDAHDRAASVIARMAPWGKAPGAYGMFLKINNKLIGQTPNQTIHEDLDDVLEMVKGTNALFVVSLDPIDGYAAVTDAAIQLFADKLAMFNSYGIPVLIRPAHEMNGPWYAWGQQPTLFKAFYRKVYTTVKAKAPYTKFIFAPNHGNGYPWTIGDYHMSPNSSDLPLADTNKNGILDVGDDPYEPYWPGSDVVDWFGVSMYWKGDYPYSVNQVVPDTFLADQMFMLMGGNISTYDYAARKNLPIMYPEMGGSFCPTNPGVANLQTKQKFWQQVFSPAAFAQMPLVKMGLWFDYLKNEDGALRDFSISNSLTGVNSSILRVAPSFKADLATYPHVVYASNLTLSTSKSCGCFKYNANALALANSQVSSTNIVLTATATASASGTIVSGSSARLVRSIDVTLAVIVIPFLFSVALNILM